jgi:hypothetical protein
LTLHRDSDNYPALSLVNHAKISFSKPNQTVLFNLSTFYEKSPMTTYLAYHKEHEHGPFGGDEFFTSKIVARGADCFVVSASKNGNNTPVRYLLEGKYRISEVNKNTTGKFSTKSWHLKLDQLVRPKDPILIDGHAEFDRELFHNNFTSGSGFGPIKDKTEGFILLFDSILESSVDSQGQLILDDLDQIDADKDDTDDPTERLDSRLSRIGQGKFRRNTIETWGGDERCAVTAIAIPALLSASHIIPWSEDVAQRKRGCNGILLCAHLDRLFDRNLIGFREGQNPDVFTLAVAPCLSGQFDKLSKIGLTTRTVLDFSNVKFADQSRLKNNLRAHLDRVLNNK